jgi:DNA-binding transcriptional MerR regulator
VSYRVEELAAVCDVAVDTVRYYQAKGLLHSPTRTGRIAVYDDTHLRRLRRIRALQRKGLSLAIIRRVLERRLSRPDADLAEAVAAADVPGDEEFLTIDELAHRSGMPITLVRAVQQAGLALGRTIDGEESFTAGDVEIVRLGLRLLDSGLPIAELIELGQRYHQAAEEVARAAVVMFDQSVRQPTRAQARSEKEASERLVAEFRELLPAATRLVAHHFRRLLLRAATEHIERVGDESEIAASRAESRRMREEGIPG